MENPGEHGLPNSFPYKILGAVVVGSGDGLRHERLYIADNRPELAARGPVKTLARGKSDGPETELEIVIFPSDYYHG